ncbi:MAG: glycosyltransferase family 2 protein [Candidatus Omnitrophica bacterium]|nr:glycosyltransferase family 2 protein [Candidatus Omnitrophota bacterium]
MALPLVSVIVTNWNGLKYLEGCLGSLIGGTFRDIELIMVDNGSEDGSAAWVMEHYPDIQIVKNPCNLGLARASNQGARLARGRYLFFFNNDTISDPHMLEELVKVMESDPRVGVAGCVTKDFAGERVLNAGVACDRYGYPYGEGEPLYVDAGIMIRKSLFDEIGGFDECFFIYKEDVDLCWRVLLLGWEVRVVPEAVFHHDSFCAFDAGGKYRTTIRKRFLSEAYTLRMLLKNYSVRSLLTVLPGYAFINAAEFFFFFLRGRWDVAFRVYAASYLWNLSNLASTLGARRRVQKMRRVNDAAILKRMAKGSGKWQLLREHGIPVVD